jgi:uncharacterized membrane protein YfhO
VTVDGVSVAVQRGPGILQGIPLPPGQHAVEARYRPPGLLVGSVVSIASLGVLVVIGRRGRRARVSAGPEPAA